MYRCDCGKEFEKKQSYVAHCGHCKIHLGRDPKDRFGESRAWNKGLTNETDKRVARINKLSGETRKGRIGKPHTEEYKHKMSEIAQYNASHHLNGWKSGSSKVPNKYEEFTEEFLRRNRVDYQREVVIPQSSLGKKGSYYQLDFLINDTIDLEIDGSSHNSSHDSLRDSYVSKNYSVYRIPHKDSLEELERLLLIFLETL